MGWGGGGGGGISCSHRSFFLFSAFLKFCLTVTLSSQANHINKLQEAHSCFRTKFVSIAGDSRRQQEIVGEYMRQ